MTAKNEILMLASKFNLEEGEYNHYYKRHQAWCVTKKGAHRIAKEAGITMQVIDCDISPCFIAYRGIFSMGDNLTAREVGSCRFDGTKNTPERSHAPEMAWKRLFVRGVLACVAPGSGIYGDEEFSLEPETVTARPQPQQVQPATVQNAPATPVKADGTTDWANDPRIAQCEAAQGWKPYAIKLPSEWNVEMAKFCELTRLARGDWETLLLDHCGKFQGEQGWWKPTSSPNYQTFADIVFTVDRNGKSKCGWALQVKKKLAEFNNDLEVIGSAQLEVPQGLDRTLSAQTIYKHGSAPEEPADSKVGGIAADVNLSFPNDLDEIPF